METKKYAIIGIIAGILILSILVPNLFISDYRDLLHQFPDKDLILLTNFSSGENIELLSRSDLVEFIRWKYKDDYVKVYFGRNLVAKSYWQLFQGTKGVYFRDHPSYNVIYKNDRAHLETNISYYLDSRHTNFVGTLHKEIELYPNLNKETIRFIPADENIKYCLRWIIETDEEDKSVNYMQNNIFSTHQFNDLDLDWSDAKEQVSWARQYKNGKIKVGYKCTEGEQFIDPIISVFNDTTSSYQLNFTGSENLTRYLSLPKYSTIHSVLLNITGTQYDSVYPNNTWLEVGTADNDREWLIFGEYRDNHSYLHWLNDSTTSKEIEIYYNTNETIYIDIPKELNTTNAVFNITNKSISGNFVNMTDAILGAAGSFGEGLHWNGSDFWTVTDTQLIRRWGKTGSISKTTCNYDAMAGVDIQDVTSNGTDFWLIDRVERWIYHVDEDCNNITDGIDISGILNPDGIDWNEDSPPTFWVVDPARKYLTHIEEDGTTLTDDNVTLEIDGFYHACTNGTDFFSYSYTSPDDYMYHTSNTSNITTGFDIADITGSTSIYGVDCDTEDIWIAVFTGAAFGFHHIWNAYNSPYEPSGFFIDVGNDGDYWEFNTTGTLSTKNETNDFNDEINDYLVDCTVNSLDYCQVPIVIHSDTSCSITIDAINVTTDNANKIDITTIAVDDYLETCSANSSYWCEVPFIFHSDSKGALIYQNLIANYSFAPGEIFVTGEEDYTEFNMPSYWKMDNINIKAINQTDGFDAGVAGAGNIYGIDGNSTDFWIPESIDDWMYHFLSDGTNVTDGFAIPDCGMGNCWVSWNGSDFWISNPVDAFIYHFNSSGDNQTDGFKVDIFGSDDMRGLDYNGSDWWFCDDTDKWIYHINSSGDNQSDGFSISNYGDACYGLKTNGSDFWVSAPVLDDWIYHFNSSGDNQTDGFGLEGSNAPADIFLDGDLFDAWIVDPVDEWVYHINLYKYSQDEQGNNDGLCNYTGENCPSQVTGLFNSYALDFDGIDDRLNITDFSQMTSISYWFKNDTRWYHALNTTNEFYLDGNNCTSLPCAQYPFINVSGDFIIGLNGSNDYFNGTLDDIRVYNITLDADHAYALYNNYTNNTFYMNITSNDFQLTGPQNQSSNMGIITLYNYYDFPVNVTVKLNQSINETVTITIGNYSSPTNYSVDLTTNWQRIYSDMSHGFEQFWFWMSMNNTSPGSRIIADLLFGGED